MIRMLPSSGRLYQRLQPDVGKVGDRKDIHHAPGLIGRIAAKRPPEALTHSAARTVTTDHVAGLDVSIRPSCSGSIRSILPSPDSPCGRARVDLQIDQAPGIIRLQPVRRIVHDLQIEIVHARLVQDHMRKFGEAVFDILDPAAADDVFLGFRRASRTSSR